MRVVERPTQRKTPTVRKAPAAHTAPWIAVLLATDVMLFIIASTLGALIGFHHWESSRIVGHLLIAEAIFVAFWVLIFDRLGLYRRTYALSMKDELYYTVTALILGTIPQLVLFTIFPEISTSRLALIYALGFSIVLVGTSRALLHRLRKSERFMGNRRTCIVGQADRVSSVMDSLDPQDESATLLIAVDDIDDTIANIDLSRGADLSSIEWFRRARECECDVLILTEIIPPRIVGPLLEVAARERIELAFAPPRITRFAYELSLHTQGHQALIVPARLPSCTPRA